jgi:hypothetical protein
MKNLNSYGEFYMGKDEGMDKESYEEVFLKVLAEGKQNSAFVQKYLKEILNESNLRRKELIALFKWYRNERNQVTTFREETT